MNTPSVLQSLLSLCCICTAGFQTSSIHMWASKHMGVSIHIQGASKHRGAQTYWGVSKHGASRHTGGCPNMGGIQTYRGYPNIWGIQTYRGCIQINKGHPNILGVSKYMGASKHMGASKCMGAYGYPLHLTKHVLFVLYMYSRHPNIFQTYGGIQTYRRVSKHIGGIPTYGVSKHTGGHPNIWGIPQSRFLPLNLYLKSDHCQILSRKVEMRFCSSSRQNIG